MAQKNNSSILNVERNHEKEIGMEVYIYTGPDTAANDQYRGGKNAGPRADDGLHTPPCLSGSK
jgi:hypothetical protein